MTRTSIPTSHNAAREAGDRLVWDVVETKPPVLRDEIGALLSGEG